MLKNHNVFLVDQETFGILTFHPSIPVMQALSEGIHNTSVMSVAVFPLNENLVGSGIDEALRNHFLLLRANIPYTLIPSECNVAKTANIQQMFSSEKMPLELITQEWINKKKLTSIRLRGLVLLEQKIDRYLTRARMFAGDDILIPFMSGEISHCDDSSSTYTDAIIEWAELAGMAPNEAYHYLSNRVMSSQLIVSRLHALWTKYVNKINSLDDEDVIQNLVKAKLEAELRAGAL